MSEDAPLTSPGGDGTEDRRTFLDTTSRAIMAAGLVSSYGTFGFVAGRFLYPAPGQEAPWHFVTRVDDLVPGASMQYESPGGARIVVARRETPTEDGEFFALSSICPHLGCQVHWQGAQKRFFCPCHNGVFDPDGVGTEGPPAKAGQSLPRYPLRVEDRMLFIQVDSGGVS